MSRPECSIAAFFTICRTMNWDSNLILTSEGPQILLMNYSNEHRFCTIEPKRMSCSHTSNTQITMTMKQDFRHSKKKTVITFSNPERTTKYQKYHSESSDGSVRMWSKSYYPTKFMSTGESIQTKFKFYFELDFVNTTVIDRSMTLIKTKNYKATKII